MWNSLYLELVRCVYPNLQGNSAMSLLSEHVGWKFVDALYRDSIGVGVNVYFEVVWSRKLYTQFRSLLVTKTMRSSTKSFVLVYMF